MTKGLVIGGEFGKILIRQKSDKSIELGELLVSISGSNKILLQVFDLVYGSQVSQQNLELISGLNLEDDTKLDFIEPNLKYYNLALAKSLITINNNNKANAAKMLPSFFSEVRDVTNDDLKFITKPKSPLFLGKLRSGSKVLDIDLFLPGNDVLTHHVLISATTGKGKSNLTSCLLWDSIDKPYCGILVLDPHDEYYGRNKIGLKDHPSKNIVYYTPKNVPVGGRTLKINLDCIKPTHFNGVVDLSDPQKQAMNSFYREYGKSWVEAVILEKPLKVDFNLATISVLKRRLLSLLNLEFDGQQLFSRGVFDLNACGTIINDIASEIEQGKIVIIDTSQFAGAVELLIGSLITTELFKRYKYYKVNGLLKDKPVVSIVIEEAPRVLGKEVLEKGSNIFSTIAREGRKFKVGLIAITQLPSLIPRQILANMNTKIILGTEMASERQAIIDSAAQDLSTDNRNIASLDKGEALVSSNFARFALPIKIPLFDDLVKKTNISNNTNNTNYEYQGVNIQ